MRLAAILGPDGQLACSERDTNSAAAHVRNCADPACESFAHEVVVRLDRLLAIESAAHALLDAYGPAMAGLEDATPAVRAAAERLGIVLARGR